MKILVNSVAAKTGGALAITRDFYNYVIKDPKEHDWIFLLSEKHFGVSDSVNIVIAGNIAGNWLARLWFDFLVGRRIVNKLKPNIVLSFTNTMIRGIKQPQVLYIHQALPFASKQLFKKIRKPQIKLLIIRNLIGVIIISSIRKAHAVIVQSRWMRDAVIRKTGINKEKVHIIEPIIDVNGGKTSSITISSTRFYYPTSSEAYKNNEIIYEACGILNDKGINDYLVELTLSTGPMVDNVKFLGRLERNELISRYNGSVLIFPSLIETYGLPLVEAKQMGNIILAVDAEYSREILEGYPNAYFFASNKPSELSQLMRKVITKEIIPIPQYHVQDLHRNQWNQITEILESIR